MAQFSTFLSYSRLYGQPINADKDTDILLQLYFTPDLILLNASVYEMDLFMKNDLAFFLFWASFFVLFYTYVGFPVLVILRGILYVRPVQTKKYTPKVSIIIAAYNEASIAKQKLDNAFSLNYPSDCLEIIFASDGSDDGTDDLVRNYDGGTFIFLSLPRQGKNKTLNDAVAISSGEILVFTDADTMFESDALNYLMAPFNDPEVGGVAGNYEHSKDGRKGGSERDFWNFERTMKLLQSRAGSVTSAWGPIYAIRSSFFKTVPIGVTDDFFISVQPLLNHHRLVFEPRALAVGPVAASSQVEFQRKVRIIAAGLRSVWQTRQLLNPFRHGFLAIQIFSHKVLRRLMGLPILLMSITALMLWQGSSFFALMAFFQLIFHGVALLGLLLQRTSIGRLRLLRLPFFFDMVYTASLLAMFNLFFGKRHDIWTPQHAHED
jgi:cellulose synthase/poly-beta-1,6-N-acetylglucosamine synthase-like glycosyltransferase